MITFTCPACGTHRIEEVMNNVTVVSEISSFYEDGDLDYGQQSSEDGEVTQYQCMRCGFIVGENEGGPIIEGLALVEWIKANCPQ
jgi:rubredoxin